MNQTQPLMSSVEFEKLADDLYILIKKEIEDLSDSPSEFGKLQLMVEFYNLIRGESFSSIYTPLKAGKHPELYARYNELNSMVINMENKFSEKDMQKADEWLNYYFKLFAPFHAPDSGDQKNTNHTLGAVPVQFSPDVYKVMLGKEDWYLVVFESDIEGNPFIPDLLDKYPNMFDYNDKKGSIILKTLELPKDVLVELVTEDPYESFIVLSNEEYQQWLSGKDVLQEGSMTFLNKYDIEK